MGPKRRPTAVADHQDLAVLDTAGWTAVPGVLSDAAARHLAEECRTTLAGIDDDVRVGDKQVSGTRRLVDLLERVPAVAAAVDHPAVRTAVGHLLGETSLSVGSSSAAPSPASASSASTPTPSPSSRPGPWQVVTAIVALCDFTPDNGVHRRSSPAATAGPTCNDAPAASSDHPDELVLTGPAGTAFVFCGHLLHRGTRNRSTAPRPALQVSWGRA